MIQNVNHLEVISIDMSQAIVNSNTLSVKPLIKFLSNNYKRLIKSILLLVMGHLQLNVYSNLLGYIFNTFEQVFMKKIIFILFNLIRLITPN